MHFFRQEESLPEMPVWQQALERRMSGTTGKTSNASEEEEKSPPTKTLGERMKLALDRTKAAITLSSNKEDEAECEEEEKMPSKECERKLDLVLVTLVVTIVVILGIYFGVEGPYPDCNVDMPSRLGDGFCDGENYNTIECGWDAGDCVEINLKYPDCHVDNPARIGDGYCDGLPGMNTAECGWDGGDCPPPAAYPDCHADWAYAIGDGNCDGGEYNTAECGWDGGDCDAFNRKYPGCRTKYVTHLGNGCCDLEHNNAECGWDGGDCKYFNTMYPGCRANNAYKIGDGICDLAVNTRECQWDGGDCTDFNKRFPGCTNGGKSCVSFNRWFNATYPGCIVHDPRPIGDGHCDDGYRDLYSNAECGWDGGDCVVPPYPDCHVDPEKIGNGVCDGEQYNTPQCGWDGGDCFDFNKRYPYCRVRYPHLVGNGHCNDDPSPYRDVSNKFNVLECGWDGGDCDLYNSFPDCKIYEPELLGNGECDNDEEHNSEACGWDG